MTLGRVGPFSFKLTAAPGIDTLSLHDALPILDARREVDQLHRRPVSLRRVADGDDGGQPRRDRKSTRLNSSHQIISYAVFCLKKKIELLGPRLASLDVSGKCLREHVGVV